MRTLNFVKRLYPAQTEEQKKLNALFQEYLKLLDNEADDDHYTTDRHIATSVFSDFMEWCVKNNKL